MPPASAELLAIEIRNPRHAVEEISRHLKELIVTGRIPAETTLTQVELARALGVSRTPVREALRILQQLGFVDLEANCRARVKGFDADALLELYATRILTEALALRHGVPALGAPELGELERALRRLGAAPAAGAASAWLAEHRRFHQRLVCHVSAPLGRALAERIERSDFYVHMYLAAAAPNWPTRLDREHRAILAAARAGDGARAAAALADHLHHTACALIGRFAPGHDLGLVDEAREMVTGVTGNR